jgi:CRP-like cAMP-binding protein
MRRAALATRTSIHPETASAPPPRRVAAKSQEAREFLTLALAGNPLFAALGGETVAVIVDAMEPRDVAQGEVLMEQGQPGDAFYIIESGKVSSAARSVVGFRERRHSHTPPHPHPHPPPPTPHPPPPTPLPHPNPHISQFEIIVDRRAVSEWGDDTSSRALGELALLYDAPRAATARALTPAHVWRIDRDTFRNATAATAYARYARVRAALRLCFRGLLDDEQVARLAVRADLVAFAEGAQIVRKGDAGEVFYIVESGSVVCERLHDILPPLAVEAGGFFGEATVVHGDPHGFDATATSDATLIAVARGDLMRLVRAVGAMLSDAAFRRTLWSVPLLRALNEAERARVSTACPRPREFEAGEVIVTQGHAVSEFLVVAHGEALIVVSGDVEPDLGATARLIRPATDGDAPPPGSPPGARVMGRLIEGAWFGQAQLAHGLPSPVTLVAAVAAASRPVKCFRIDRDTFALAVVPAHRRLREGGGGGEADDAIDIDGFAAEVAVVAAAADGAGPDAVIAAAAQPPPVVEVVAPPVDLAADAGVPAAAPPGAPHRRLGLHFADLEPLRTLGTGTFGRVRLVRHAPSGRAFALKSLLRTRIDALRQRGNVIHERDILMLADHPFINRLHDTYRDRLRLHFLLEYVPGGELFSRLQNSPTPGRISVADARFYAACVLDALAHLHSVNVAYRDLKPENILIDSDGYVKLADFGLAKVVREQRTFTLCGTSSFMAPEVITGIGHGTGVDLWALGALLFEMVAGYGPFEDRRNNDDHHVMLNILQGAFAFPPHVTDVHFRDIVFRLLAPAPALRLGCQPGGIDDVRAHPFFAGVDFGALRRREVAAPWIPNLAGAFDAAHFDNFDEEDDDEGGAAAAAPGGENDAWDAGF